MAHISFPMPRYFFHFHHERSHFDLEGEELADKHAARHEAVVATGHILRDLNRKLTPGHELRVEVTDEFANPLYLIYVSLEQT